MFGAKVRKLFYISNYNPIYLADCVFCRTSETTLEDTPKNRRDRHLILSITPQLGEQIRKNLFSIGWGHHKVLIDKNSKQPSCYPATFLLPDFFSMQLITLMSQTPCLWAFFSDISDIEVRFWGCF